MKEKWFKTQILWQDTHSLRDKCNYWTQTSFSSGLWNTDRDKNLTWSRLSGLETAGLDQKKAISAKVNLQLSFHKMRLYDMKNGISPCSAFLLTNWVFKCLLAFHFQTLKFLGLRKLCFIISPSTVFPVPQSPPRVVHWNPLSRTCSFC